MASWDGDLTLRFIEMYKCHPVLWDPKDLNYKNKPYRQEALMDISKQLGIEKNELERKIKNLTSHYLRERRRTNSLKRNRLNKPYHSKWFAFKALEFLSRRDDVWYTMLPEPSQMVEIEMDNNISKKDISKDKDGAQVPRNNNKKTEKEYLVKTHLEKSLTGANDHPTEPLLPSQSSSSPTATIVQNNHSIYERTDEYGLLGEEVAMKVRTLPTKYARCIVRFKIQKLLFKASLGRYDYPKTTAVSSGADTADVELPPTTFQPTVANLIIDTNDVNSESSTSSILSPLRDFVEPNSSINRNDNGEDSVNN